MDGGRENVCQTMFCFSFYNECTIVKLHFLKKKKDKNNLLCRKLILVGIVVLLSL